MTGIGSVVKTHITIYTAAALASDTQTHSHMLLHIYLPAIPHLHLHLIFYTAH